MNDNDSAVLGQLYIGFDARSAKLERFFECRKCIFGTAAACSAMGEINGRFDNGSSSRFEGYPSN